MMIYKLLSDLFHKHYVDIFATPYKRPCKDLPKERDFTNETKIKCRGIF